MSTAVTPVPVLEAVPARMAPLLAAATPPVAETSAEPSLRLVIEEVGFGSFVYKTLDRTTGEVVRQFPREDVVKMMSDDSYAPGDLIQTEA